MSKADEFGRVYFCVGVPREIATAGVVYVWADKIGLDDAGNLIFYGTSMKMLLAFAKGSWFTVYSANATTGAPLAVEHWKEMGKQ
jgi:hypothetical protein